MMGSCDEIPQSRTKLQQQFDRWYQGVIGYERPVVAEAKMVAQPTDHIKAAPTNALPEGLKLTGNKEVDEDILAFYK